ncbi:MAG: UDP-N-acetylmuramate--L-alanine ligase [Saprospiraceae bacterium]
MNLSSIHNIYFIGIGGIGMSALARYFKLQGAAVYGYDRTETELTKALVAEGMAVHYEDDVTQIPENVDLVVYTPAVPADHSELSWFRDQGYPVKKRAEVLGIISRAKRCIAIAGTHGKTTTSTMTSHLLRSCGIDATAFVGGISGNLSSNFAQGTSDWVVVEADEYDRSFLHLHPEIAVINSVDADHLDIYGSEAEVRASYAQFASQLKPGGRLLLEQGVDIQVDNALRFGPGAKNFEPVNIRMENGFSVFDLLENNGETSHTLFTGLKLPYPGLHNVKNATAAIAATILAGGNKDSITAALEVFKGVKRRFETICKSDDVVYIDDYAHHPAELNAAISAARDMYPGKKLTAVFQPHLFTRTRDFANEFAKALDKLDACVLLPIYPARELPIEGVNSEMLLNKMTLKNKQLLNAEQLLTELKNDGISGVLMTMGAGDIDKLIEPIKNLLNSKKQ